ncbi:MAG: DUF1361 domain-containing protein, partial [Erysipelotrichaceae bacterium]|nr:DUF1361 domain-containing protein [Erysipelotrichaceae bacterium]
PKFLALLIWLVFLPNAFYMLTDIMHIQFLVLETSSSAYVINGYSRDIVEWMTFFTILSMGIYGFLLGCHSVVDMTTVIKPIHDRVFYVIISILSAIGIYIGRFLRFNTWDLIHPRSLLRTVLASADRFTVMFVVVMSVVIYTGIIRYAKTHLMIDEQKKTDS